MENKQKFVEKLEKKAYFFHPDQRPSVAPLFEVQLDLKVPDLVFTPPLDIRVGDSFFEIVETLINDVFRISSLVPRVAQHSTFPHYQVIYQRFFLNFSIQKSNLPHQHVHTGRHGGHGRSC